MKIPIYQVDAFTSEVFSGNPAAVCLLDEWIDDRRLLFGVLFSALIFVHRLSSHACCSAQVEWDGNIVTYFPAQYRIETSPLSLI